MGGDVSDAAREEVGSWGESDGGLLMGMGVGKGYIRK